MLTQGALRDKDEWGSEMLHVKTDFFFFIEVELMLISDCIFASLIVIEILKKKVNSNAIGREKERREKKGVLLIMRGDC